MSNYTPEQIEELKKFRSMLTEDEVSKLNKFLAEMSEILISDSGLEVDERLRSLNEMELIYLVRIQESRKGIN